jgi:hypothetical protein
MIIINVHLQFLYRMVFALFMRMREATKYEWNLKLNYTCKCIVLFKNSQQLHRLMSKMVSENPLTYIPVFFYLWKSRHPRSPIIEQCP